VFFSPAKVNLFFRVLSKRPDGYHEVASLYSAINLGDWIEVKQSNKDQFESNLQIKDNLVLKALEAFRIATGITDRISIWLDKKVPIGAGLGGGSSNAATTLWALNELFDQPLSREGLIQIGSTIGSDIPFFFSNGLAYCTGKGEILQSVDFSFPNEFWVAKPEYSLLTPNVYAVCKPNAMSQENPLHILDMFSKNRPVFVNDLEKAAFELLPQLKLVKENLLNLGFSKIVMTGSGTAFLCFGEVNTPSLPCVRFYRIQSINRSLDDWYHYSSCRK